MRRTGVVQADVLQRHSRKKGKTDNSSLNQSFAVNFSHLSGKNHSQDDPGYGKSEKQISVIRYVLSDIFHQNERRPPNYSNTEYGKVGFNLSCHIMLTSLCVQIEYCILSFQMSFPLCYSLKSPGTTEGYNQIAEPSHNNRV